MEDYNSLILGTSNAKSVSGDYGDQYYSIMEKSFNLSNKGGKK